MLIAQNEDWRIRMRVSEDGVENYALTKARGRFTIYLRGKSEKIAFYKTLENIMEENKGPDMKNARFLIQFGIDFAIWLTVKDIIFILNHLPISDSEKSTFLNNEIPHTNKH